MNRNQFVRCLLLVGLLGLGSPLRASATGGGTLNFNNHVAGADAPVFDGDGVTRLAGTNFLADLCAGPLLEAMVAVGPARPFHTGAGAGYVNPLGDSARSLVNVAPGATACVRMRAWATADGASFEEAIRKGGRFGQSKVITVVTGGAGFPPSLPANLVGLESFSLGEAPCFIRDLSDRTAFTGEIVGFEVEVAHAPSASCQWSFNGSPVPGAVGFQYFVTASTMTAGAWRAQVNYAQTNLLSRTAVLTVLPIPSGATLRFTNRLPGAGLDAPVFDLDGSTRLAGPGFVAQLRAGTNPDSLEALGDPVPLLDGVDAGYWRTSGEFWRSVPGISPGQKVWAQVEVWELAKGDSYETSLANGGKVGKSELIEVVTGGEGSTSPIPAPLNGLASFRVDRLPVFTLQPASQSVVTEAPVRFLAEVESYSQVSFQWYFNGAPLPGATNTELSFPSAAFELAGQYTLVANNAVGKTTSAVATLEVKAVSRGGTIRFSNRILGSALDAPVWDVDGVTRLAGDGFVAELWAGPSPDTLAPAWPPATFRTGDGAGYLNPGTDATRTLDNVAPGAHAYARIRVWEHAAGATYAEAVAAGGKAGQSAVVELVTGGAGVPPSLPAELAGLTSFALGEAPEILRMTSGHLLRLAGETVVLEAEVRSYSPLQYRWEHNGQAVAEANGPTLTLRDLASEHSGEYRMIVSNQTGSRSAVVLLEVRALPAGALLKFSNRDPKAGLDAPVYDLDGVTLLQGAAYAAQLFAGTDPTNLVAIGQPAPFQGDPGYWSTDLAGAEYWREIPGLEPGGTAYVQVRIWEIAKGTTYEDALAAGGKVAESEVLAMATGGRGATEPLPAPLTGLVSLRMHRRPILVETPASQSVYPNRELSLKVRAESVDPVAYQWYLDGHPIQQATNSTFNITAMQEADFGEYDVVVSNPTGSVTSPPATITKLVLNSGGTIIFVNYDPGAGLIAPIYDVDGLTPLQGTGFVVQLWAGPGPNQLVPVGQAVTFAQDGIIATDTNTVRVLPNVAPDELAFVQYRAWDSAAGSSFDTAVQSGGKAGVSDCLSMSAGGAGLPATLPLGLNSFQLDTALVKLSATRSGANVAIEVSSNLIHWVPAMTVSNAPTEVLFRDPQATNEPARFYRLRDAVTSNILSSNMFGVMHLSVPPGLSMLGLPLALADATIQRAFSDLPEGSTVYQYDTVARRYWINTFEFGEWSLPHRQVAPGEGCLILNPTDQACVLTVRGNVRQGTVRQTLPQGWSMQANQLPRAGSAETVLGLPLEDGDIVVRLTPDGEMLIDVLMGGWWGGQAPEIQMGEAFWIWKNRPTVWQQNAQWPE